MYLLTYSLISFESNEAHSRTILYVLQVPYGHDQSLTDPITNKYHQN